MAHNNIIFIFGLCVLTIWDSCQSLQDPTTPPNDRPIVGIIIEETWDPIDKEAEYVLIAAYQSFVEIAGGRVAPIFLGQPESYYEDILNSVNGVIIPGGKIPLSLPEYHSVVEYVFNYAVRANDRGDYFPLWGVCLGMEMFIYLLASEEEPVVPCDAESYLIELNPVIGAREHSRFLKTVPNDMYDMITTEKMAHNNHLWCVPVEKFESSPAVTSFYRIVATNFDRQGLQFVSMMEAYNYPFYGLHWHPEKNNVIFDPAMEINHTSEAMKVTQHFANFFMDEVRKNHHSFSDDFEEAAAMIYNYQPRYMGLPTMNVLYLFNMSRIPNSPYLEIPAKTPKVLNVIDCSSPSDPEVEGLFITYEEEEVPAIDGNLLKSTLITGTILIILCLVMGFLLGRYIEDILQCLNGSTMHLRNKLKGYSEFKEHNSEP